MKTLSIALYKWPHQIAAANRPPGATSLDVRTWIVFISKALPGAVNFKGNATAPAMVAAPIEMLLSANGLPPSPASTRCR